MERTRMKPGGGVLGALLTGLAMATATPVVAQIPDEFTNLRYFPEDIGRDQLIGTMRRFSLNLGVRCQFCHVGSVDGVSFEGVDFASDESPHKVTARYMLGLVDRLNSEISTELPDRESARDEITCKTCHRGLSRPTLLYQKLEKTLQAEGVDGLEDAYAEARQALESGTWDFGEWELNLFAEDLDAEGRSEDAIAILELNREQHQNSTAILGALAGLHERAGDVEEAIAAYERILEIQPGNRGAQARLAALRGGG